MSYLSTNFLSIAIFKVFLDADKSIFYAIEMKKMYDNEEESISSDHARKKFIVRAKRAITHKIDENYLSKISDFVPEDAGNKLQEIESVFRCKIYCWQKYSTFSKWKCIRRSPVTSESAFDTIVDIIVPFNEVKISLQDVKLVLDADKTFPIEKRFRREKWTLFESLAILKNPELRNTICELRVETQKLENMWGKESVHTIDSKEFKKLFNVSLQIWKKIHISDTKVERIKTSDRLGTPKLIGRVHYCLI